MSLPDHILYKDLNQDSACIEIKLPAIEFFLKQVHKEIDKTAENLYQQRFLKFIRLAHHQNMYFFKSACRAQMRRNVSYQVDVCVDEDGCVVETQCECAAGMGPTAHCKHVCAVLLAISKFSSTKEILTEETCTQRIQTFHHCKQYSGSPLKSADLPLARQDIDINFDPRPNKFKKRKGYNDEFRSICINHSSMNKLPISQLFPPANTHAVDLDHDYCSVKCSDIWLNAQNISKISSEEIVQFERQTVGQSKNKLWLTQRCKRLHSSKFGRICKATDKTDHEKLARSLTVSQQIHAAPILHGQKYESVALAKYEEITGNVATNCGTFVSETHPFLAASPDAYIKETNQLVEIKCPFSSKNQMITPQTVPYLKITDQKLTLDPNHDYYFQVQGQLFCCKKNVCDFVVYTFKDMKIISLERDEKFISEMIKKLECFYESYFKTAVLEKFFFRQYYDYSF